MPRREIYTIFPNYLTMTFRNECSTQIYYKLKLEVPSPHKKMEWILEVANTFATQYRFDLSPCRTRAGSSQWQKYWMK